MTRSAMSRLSPPRQGARDRHVGASTSRYEPIGDQADQGVGGAGQVTIDGSAAGHRASALTPAPRIDVDTARAAPLES